MKKKTTTSIAVSPTGSLERLETKEFRNTSFKPTQFTTKLTALSAVLVATTSLASAASLVEYFNGYGTSTVVLNGLGSASGGWAGPWGGSALPDYKANSSLSYTATGYSGSGNGTTNSDGASGLGASGGNGDIATRTFTTGMTGTVWVSTLAFLGNNTTARSLLWLDGTNNYISLYDEAARLNAGGTFTDTAIGTVAVTTTYHLLARLSIDVSGTNDRIEYWLNPNLATGMSGLGAPTLSNTGSESDLFGTSLDSIVVSFRLGGSLIDSIRISNDANGFDFVTTGVPEPSALLLGILGAGFFGLRRKR